MTLTATARLCQSDEQHLKLSLFRAPQHFFLQDESVVGAAASTVVSALHGTPVKIFRLVRITNTWGRFSLSSRVGGTQLTHTRVRGSSRNDPQVKKCSFSLTVLQQGRKQKEGKEDVQKWPLYLDLIGV